MSGPYTTTMRLALGLALLPGLGTGLLLVLVASRVFGRFLLLRTRMVAMAARMLPVLSADLLKRRLRLELTVDLLFVGAFVRVAAEAPAGVT